MEPDFWGGGRENEPVPAVDPVDLRRAWSVFQDLQLRRPNEQVAIGLGAFACVCSAGADLGAVSYRAAMLQLLCRRLDPLSGWLRDGKLANVVFEIAATFRMKYLREGTVQQGPPLDVQEFMKGIQRKLRD
jgi:hypothetical protein